MPRTRAFDRAEVVRQARSVFWAQGFEVASIPQLEAATGLSRSSIYNEFGSKDGLFDAAVASYLTEVVYPPLRPLQQEGVEAHALAEYLHGLQQMFARGAAEAARFGCLLINSAAAPVGQRPEVANAVRRYRRSLAEAIGQGMAAAHPAQPASQRQRLVDAVTALVVAAFALVRVDRAQAAQTLASAVEIARP